MEDFNNTDFEREKKLISEESDNQREPDDENYVKSNISPIAAAFIGLLGGFFLYQFVGGLLSLLIFGFDLESASVTGLRLMTMAGQILFILLPAIVFSKIFYENVNKILRFKLPDWKEISLFTIGIIILTPLLQSYLYIQNYYIGIWAKNSEFINSIKSFFDSLNELVEKTYGNLLSAGNVFELLFVVLIVAVVPALAEEFMFRGYIQRSFELKIKPVFAALITATFFSLYHFNPYGFIPLIVLGFYFGFAAYASKSLIIPIFLHFLNNFSAVLLFYIVGDDELIKSDVTVAQDGELFFYASATIGLLFLFFILIFIIKKYYSVKSKI